MAKIVDIIKLLKPKMTDKGEIKLIFEQFFSQFSDPGIEDRALTISYVNSQQPEDEEEVTLLPSAQDRFLAKILAIRFEDTDHDIFKFAVNTNNVELVSTILSQLDTKGMLIQKITENYLYEAIKLGHYEVFEVLHSVIKPEEDKIPPELKLLALKNHTYPLIADIFSNTPIDCTQTENALAIAANKHDLCYLLSKFSSKVLSEAKDDKLNNILHLAMQCGNRNIIQYLLNHGHHNLAYQENSENNAPIHLAYELTQKTKDTDRHGRTTYDFSLLAMIDQLGVDLQLAGYNQELYKAYHHSLKKNHPYVLVKQASANRTIEAISFNGGGMKGVAFISAYEEAVKQNLIKPEKVKAYAGTSAGAMTAGLFALGYTPTECEQILENFEFEKVLSVAATPALESLITNHLPILRQYYADGRYYTLAMTVATIIGKEMAPGLKWLYPSTLRTAISNLLETTTGVFVPTYLENQLKECIRNKINDIPVLNEIDPEFITFEDLHLHGFKQLKVYVTNMNSGEAEEWSYETKPKASYLDAMINSGLVPLVFASRPEREVIIENGKRVFSLRKNKNGDTIYCCDGGVLKNDPVDAHDLFGFNENALTFLLVSEESKDSFENQLPHPSKKIDNTLQVVLQLLHMHRSMERKQYHLDPRNLKRIVYINTKKVGMLDFHNAEKNKTILTPSGRNGVIDYLNRCTANGHTPLRHEMIRLLLSYKLCSPPQLTGNGHVIEIRPSQKLLPQDIVRIYAASTEAELPLLRSILNSNTLHNGITALSIAKALGLNNTADRLIKAGANPSFTLLNRTESLPDYFKKGETFLENTLTEKELEHQCTLNGLQTENAQLQATIRDLNQHNETLLKDNSVLRKMLATVYRLFKLFLGKFIRSETQIDHFKYKNENFRSTFAALMEPQLLARHTRLVNDTSTHMAIQALREQQFNLARRKCILEAELKSDPKNSKKIDQLSRIKDKVSGIAEIIFKLRTDLHQDAHEIIEQANNQHPQLFNSPFWHSSNTKKCCEEVEKAEIGIKRAIGIPI